MGFYSGRRVLVTGGASFIGSHLTERLLELGAVVTVADDLSSGLSKNLSDVIDDVRFLEVDLRDTTNSATASRGQEIVFHLAADHGGRGYIDTHNLECGGNMTLDQAVFDAALRAGCSKVVFASSGCIYPLNRQESVTSGEMLTEEMVGPPYWPDGLYGLAKLAGELYLREQRLRHGIDSVSCRYFTAYGPRAKENHAIMAMIARAYLHQDPFEVWGDGSQLRNWTYVADIIDGTLSAGEHIDDGSAVNIGTEEETSVSGAAQMIMQCFGYSAPLAPLPHMPTGPVRRIASIAKARTRLGFEPRWPLAAGVKETVAWYQDMRTKEDVEAALNRGLLERNVT
ncbi:NAD-dependent epimerase/dehydratase family protein [Nocardia beijingensis]